MTRFKDKVFDAPGFYILKYRDGHEESVYALEAPTQNGHRGSRRLPKIAAPLLLTADNPYPSHKGN